MFEYLRSIVEKRDESINRENLSKQFKIVAREFFPKIQNLFENRTEVFTDIESDRLSKLLQLLIVKAAAFQQEGVANELNVLKMHLNKFKEKKALTKEIQAELFSRFKNIQSSFLS